MRKKRAKARVMLPDPKFGDVLVTKFVNNLMKDGKKSLAFKIFYKSLDLVADKSKDIDHEPLDIWKKAIDNVMPRVEVRSKRVGGATLQVPVEVRRERRVSLGIRWMIWFARKRNEKSMSQNLAAEIMAAFKEEGASYKKKVDTHKMAEANKAFSHFRF